MNKITVHKPVLLKEILENLNLKKDAILVDGTFGGGGHSVEILKKYPEIKIIAIDSDEKTFGVFLKNFKNLENRISFVNNNFRNLKEILEKESFKKIDGIILDLGISSDQLENSGRGFSFQKNEPLLMTLKNKLQKNDLTAREIVNTWAEDSLSNILYGYGEEKFSRKIARAIVESREKKEIKTTFDLVEILEKVLPKSYQNKKISCATKTFQALRIAVNDELRSLEEVLENSFKFLNTGGRILVISFHSLEDRIVKRFFKNKKEEAILINKKPIIASIEEVKNNPRSRSAKLRILEKL
jgi:16S rRNA (cytosine1402-N4)-methyltransferase